MAKKVTIGALSAVALMAGIGAAVPFNVHATALTGDLTLEEDVAECYTIGAGQNITINLNGYKINCTGGSAIKVEAGGRVTVTGTGEVNALSSGEYAAVYNNIGGTATLKGGTYRASNWYTLKNLGNMTIDGGIFNQGDGITSGASLVDNGWYNGSSPTGASDQGNAHTAGLTASLTINGGTFNHQTDTSTIKSDDYSKTVINDGEFNSADGFLIQATGDVEVNGGDFTGYDSMFVLYGDGSTACPGTATMTDGVVSAKYIATADWGGGTLDITGGIFSDLEGITDPDSATSLSGDEVIVSGGLFNVDPSAYVENGYVAVGSSEGFGVAEATETGVEGLEANQNVSIEVKNDLTQEEATQLAELSLAEGLTDLNIAGIMNINMYEDGAQVTETENEVTFTMTVDPSILTAPEGYVRTMYVVQFHDGEATLVPVTVDLANGTVTFTINKFSTYALAYEDAVDPNGKSEVNSPETGSFTQEEASATTSGVFAAITAGVLAITMGVVMIVRRIMKR